MGKTIIVDGFRAVLAKPHLGWARGPDRHGGGALAVCDSPLISTLILSPFLIKKKGQMKIFFIFASQTIKTNTTWMNMEIESRIGL